MSKIDDMILFVQVVKASGLAAAGRQIGLSPASMTARINALEQRYNTRLLNRTTRKISLTEAGQRFYDACLRVLAEVESAETLLQNTQENLSGQLRITAPSDFGRQFVAPALSQFIQQHPEVKPYLHLTDGVVDLVEYGYDLGIRYGNLPDSNLIIQHLANNHRVLVASPKYLEQYGMPQHPDDLSQHRCLTLERLGETFNEWHFQINNEHQVIKIKPALSSNDGAVIRQWALDDKGITYKSSLDVQQDLDTGRLQTLLDDFVLGFHNNDDETTRLQFIYPSRRYVPRQVSGFIAFLKTFLSDFGHL